MTFWQVELCMCLALCCVSTLGQDSQSVTAPSTIVTGKVIAIGTAPFPGIPASGNLITVEVENVSKAPPAVSIKKSDSVAIYDPQAQSLQVGAKVTFYANVWVLGAGTALRALNHTVLPNTASATSNAAETILDADKERNKELLSRLNAADVAFIGKVAQVQAPATAAFGSHKRITEHDPMWQDAVLEVHSWIKGSSSGPHVVVRFPSSRDVAFRNYPKFQPGEEGTFLLHKDQVSAAPFASFSGSQVPTFIVPDRADVMDVSEGAKLKALANNQ